MQTSQNEKPRNETSLEPQAAETRDPEKGAVGWILLWLIGIPIPILIVLWLLRGGT